MQITLPWPDRDLSPNARVHYKRRAEAVKDARDLAYLETRLAREVSVIPPLHAAWFFYPPDNRKRDLDNMLSMCKAYQDGIFQALGLDDSAVRTVSLRKCKPVKNGMVKVEICQDEF